MTRVISVRGRKRTDLIAEHGDDLVYVGRAFAGWPGSVWGNPFRPSTRSPGDVAYAVDLYRRGIERRIDLHDLSEAARRLPELRGRILACWCCDWNPGDPVVRPCHAIVLAKLADSPMGNPVGLEDACRESS